MKNIALYGFGRIGRQFLRIDCPEPPVVRARVDFRDEATLAALFAVDTNYGRWPEPVAGSAGQLKIGDQTISYLNSAKEVPDWAALGVDLVVDCTGQATTRAGAQAHFDRGAKYGLEDEWASCRIVADAHTAVIDLPLTAKQGQLLSVASWYDNEWGFSNRLADRI